MKFRAKVGVRRGLDSLLNTRGHLYISSKSRKCQPKPTPLITQ